MKKHDLDLVGLSEAAATLGTSMRQMLGWTRRGDFPEPIARLHAPRWHRADILRWSKDQQSAAHDNSRLSQRS